MSWPQHVQDAADAHEGMRILDSYSGSLYHLRNSPSLPPVTVSGVPAAAPVHRGRNSLTSEYPDNGERAQKGHRASAEGSRNPGNPERTLRLLWTVIDVALAVGLAVSLLRACSRARGRR
jgi:hypothetical protein